jgi:predicted nucleic acid-binding protein
MYVVDASVWVARFNQRDRFYAASRAWITAMMSGATLMVEPSVVLPEVSGALSRALGNRETADLAVASITNFPTVVLIPVEVDLSRRSADIAASLRLRGYDAVYIALAEQEGMDLVSWDNDHLVRGSQRVRVHRPDDLLATPRGPQ